MVLLRLGVLDSFDFTDQASCSGVTGRVGGVLDLTDQSIVTGRIVDFDFTDQTSCSGVTGRVVGVLDPFDFTDPAWSSGVTFRVGGPGKSSPRDSARSSRTGYGLFDNCEYLVESFWRPIKMFLTLYWRDGLKGSLGVNVLHSIFFLQCFDTVIISTKVLTWDRGLKSMLKEGRCRLDRVLTNILMQRDTGRLFYTHLHSFCV